MKKLIYLLLVIISIAGLAGCDRIVTVALEENGGNTVSDVEVIQNNTIDEPSISRDGYTFVGWFEDAEFTTEYNFDSPVIRNITLYAKWSVNSYNVTFIYNNGEDNTSVTGDFGTTITLPAEPTKTGYVFLGWYLDNEGTEVLTNTNFISEDFTLYAQWAPETYTINFYISEDSETPIYTEEVNYGETVVSIPSIPVVTGMDGAWDKDFTFVDQDLDIYPLYTIQTFTVTFLDYEGNIYNTMTVNYGDLIVPDSTPSRVGYDFIGYLNDATELNIDLTTYTVTQDVTIQDVFQIQTFAVNFFGGESNTLIGTTQYVDYGSDALAPTEGLERLGYTFTGWNIDFTNVTDDINVYAVYEINQYQYVFDANGGIFADGSSVIDIIADYNSNVTVTEEPTKEGFIFVGWYTDLTYETEVYFGTGIAMPLGGATVYAKWVELVSTMYTVSGTYYFESEGIAADQLSLDGTFTVTSSQAYTPFINILYDTDMSPIRNIEGYEFYKYVYNGQEYFDENQLINITQDETIDVYYRRTILSIDFMELINNENVLTTYYVYYNESIINPPIPTPVEGMTVIWEHQNFDNIRSSLVIAAIQYNNSLQSVVFTSNGSTIYIGTNDPAYPHTILITGDSPLWNITQNGYRFDGWYIAGTDIKIELGDIYFDNANFTENVTLIEARWIALDKLNEAEINDVIIDDITETINIIFSILPVNINGIDTYPIDFEFILNSMYIKSDDVAEDSLMNYISNDGNTFTLTLDNTSPYYDLFRNIIMHEENGEYSLIPGTHFLQIIGLGDNNLTLSSDISNTYEYQVKSVYEGIPEDITIKDYYLIEDFGNSALRYVFYANLSYQFSGMEFEIVTGSNHITANGDILTTSDIPGEFVFTINNGVETKTYNGIVISDIRQFNIGASYQNYLSQIDENTENDIFLNTAQTPYYVGANNEFYLDILIRNNNGSKVELSEAILNYSFYLNGSEVALDDETLATYVSLDGNVMLFTEAAIGQTFEITVEPKYEAIKMDMPELTYTITVNDGYNVFTNDQLKALYSDFNVNLINIHRDIEAQLYSNQLNIDGTPINYLANAYNDYNNYGNVYYRINGNLDNDSITIEGNYMTIDGSNIPYINPNMPGESTIKYSQAFDVVSVQIGIFYYDVHGPTVTLNDSRFTTNNLRILGNTTTPSINYGGTEEEIQNEERLMSQNSGGMLGIVIRSGKADLNNLVIGYTNIGVTTNAHGETTDLDPLTVDMDYLMIYDSWANSIYGWGSSGITIQNSSIYTSGGASIHYDDVLPGTEGYNDPILKIGDNVEFNNWISGQEAWFKAYAMSTVALQLKSNINNGIDPLGKTVLQIKPNPVTGLDTEMMNLIFLSLPQTGAVTYENPEDLSSVLTASEVALDITDATGTTILERSWDFPTQLFPIDATTSITDPRVIDGQYGFALGSLSDTYSFLQMIADIKLGYYNMTGLMMSDADAGNLASIAGFYNLSAEEALTVAGYMGAGYTLHQSVAAIKGSLDYDQPRFIEVIAPLPLTGAAGSATILIEIFNTQD